MVKAVLSLWRVEGMGSHGPVTARVAAFTYHEALERFRFRHRGVRIISIVKEEAS